MFFYFVVLLIFQCPNRVYNASKGPFPMNLAQFRDHLKTNFNLFGYKSFFSFRWFLLQAEYVQIELGQNAIDQSTTNAFRIFYGHYSYGKLLHTFSRVLEPTIDTPYMTLYVKFASHDQSYSKIRYPYRFQSFSINTLRCIVEQLTISSTEFMRWPEKSIYIEKIEQMYNQNPIVFNKKVITKCGILIGYLYQPTNEYVFPGYSYEYHKFSENVRAFDTSCSYTPYVSYVLVGLFIYLSLQTVVHLIRTIIQLISLPVPILHLSVQKQMRESNITSVEDLDDLLLNTDYKNNHYDRLFIVRNKYLVMFMIDLQENNEEILRRYYEDVPFVIIPIETIRCMRSDCIVIENNNSQCVYFPVRPYTNRFNPENWLHGRLIVLNHRYRCAYVRFFLCFVMKNRF
jgi:hypothetical protein